MFLHPLGLLALLGVPVVVAAHLFRRRFRPRTVSAVFLWRDEDSVPQAGRRRERLRASPSFWAELLAASALGLALGGPRACGPGTARHLVVVLDGSASMGARTPAGRLADLARTVLDERIDALPARSRVTVLQSGPRPRILAGPAAFPAEASERAAGFQPRAERHALAPTLALALELSGGGRVLVLTDRFEPDEVPAEVELVSVGQPLDNVALTHATRLRGDASAAAVEAGDRVLVTVTSFARRARSASIEVRTADAVVAASRLDLEPDQRRHLSFRLPPGAGVVELRLVASDPDALALDDAALLAAPPPRTLAVGTGLDADTARRLGLATGQSDSLLDRLLDALPQATEALDATTAHLWLDTLAAGSETTWCLVLEPLPPAEVDGARVDRIGPFLAEKRHPLLDGLTLDGLVWSAAPDLRLPGVPLISSGSLALLSEEERGPRRLVHLNLDPSRSSLARSPDWPILLTNLAELRRRALPGPERTNLAVGERFVWRDRRPATYTVRPLTVADAAAEGAAPRELPGRETLVVDGLDAPGLYALERDGAELTRFAVHFADPRESDLRGLLPGRRESERDAASLTAALDTEELLLFAAALAALLFDVWVLGRGDRLRAARLGKGAPWAS